MADQRPRRIHDSATSAPPESVIFMPLSELKALREHAQKLTSALPREVLLGMDQSPWKFGRPPGIAEAARLFVAALRRHPDLIWGSFITLDQFDKALAMEAAVMRLYHVARRLAAGGANGSILSGHLLLSLCSRAVAAAAELEAGLRHARQRYAVKLGFMLAVDMWDRLSRLTPPNGPPFPLVTQHKGPLMQKLIDLFLASSSRMQRPDPNEAAQ
jgi:hypothetical protein